MNLRALCRVLKDGYEDRGVFEPEEKFWKAIKEVIDTLETKNKEKKRPARLSRRRLTAQRKKHAESTSKSDNRPSNGSARR